MNRIQRLGIPALLTLINLVVAAMLLLNREMVDTRLLAGVLVGEAMAIVFLAYSLQEEGSDLLRPGVDRDAERDAGARELDSLRNALSEVERERQRLISQQGVAQADVEQAKVELARTKAALRTHDETLSSTRRQLEDATMALKNAEINAQTRNAELEQLRQWRTRAESELSGLQQQVQEFNLSRSTVEQERSASQDRLRSLEKRQAVLEQELMNRSALLQATLESIPEAVVVVAADLRPVLFNVTATQLLGIDASDVNLAQSVPKFGIYLPDRITQVGREALPFVNALRGVATEPVDLFIRNSRRPAGVSVRAIARAVGESTNRTAIFVLQEVRGHGSVPPVNGNNNGPPLEPPASGPVVVEKAAPPDPVASRSEAEIGPLRVLLVEDSAVNQKLGVRVIEQTGHRATVAGSGLDALAHLEREEFDLVLMDLTMPGMGGIETTALIREQEGDSKKRVPIVAVTASSKEGSRDRCLQWGMDGYIVKPLQPSKLEEVITMLFKSTPRT